MTFSDFRHFSFGVLAHYSVCLIGCLAFFSKFIKSAVNGCISRCLLLGTFGIALGKCLEHRFQACEVLTVLGMFVGLLVKSCVSFGVLLGVCFHECLGSRLVFGELPELLVDGCAARCLLFCALGIALGKCLQHRFQACEVFAVLGKFLLGSLPIDVEDLDLLFKSCVSFGVLFGECFDECASSRLVFDELPELLVKCSTSFCLALGECFQDSVGARLTFTEFFNGSLLGLGKSANNSGDLPKLLHNHLNPLIAFHVAFSEGSGVRSKLLQKASYPFNLLLKCVALLSVNCIHHICSFEPTQIETRAEITSIALPSRPRGLHPLTQMEEPSKHERLPQ